MLDTLPKLTEHIAIAKERRAGQHRVLLLHARSFLLCTKAVHAIRLRELAKAFGVIQGLIRAKQILAGHDVSDGGILTAILEMGFAGDFGVRLDLPSPVGATEGGVARSLAMEKKEPAMM